MVHNSGLKNQASHYILSFDGLFKMSTPFSCLVGSIVDPWPSIFGSMTIIQDNTFVCKMGRIGLLRATAEEVRVAMILCQLLLCFKSTDSD